MPQLKRDLQILRLRGVLDPKVHFKKQSAKSQEPRYCHVGQVVEGPTEFFSARLAKKGRKRSLADEVLAISGLKAKTKARYSVIQEKRTNGRKGFYKKFLAQRRRGLC
jgi:Fcf2 pre-rRNA processing protein